MHHRALPELLVEARSAKGLSQTDLARVVGIAPAQISRYEQGKNVPRPHILSKIDNALGTNIYAVLSHGVAPNWLRAEGPANAHKNTVTLSFTPAEYEEIAKAAGILGLPVEDAMIAILRDELSKRINRQLGGEFVAPASGQDSLLKIKSSLEELQKRVEELSREKRS